MQNLTARPALVACLVLAMLGWCVAGDVSGPEPRGATAKNAPVQMGAYAQPSALPSPITAGKVDRITTDGEGNLWTRIRSAANLTITSLLTADSDTSANTTPGAGVLLLAPAAGGAVAMPGNATAGLHVSIRDTNGAAVAIPNGVVVQGAAANGATAAGLPVQVGGVYRATPSTLTDGQAGSVLLNSSGCPMVAMASAAGAAISDGFGVFVQGGRAHDATISTSAPVRIAGRARATNYSTVSADDVADWAMTLEGQGRVVTDACRNAVGVDSYCTPAFAGGSSEVTVKASAGNVYDLHVANPNTTDVYLLLFDASNPTPGTTAPTRSFCIPGGSGSSNCGVYDLTLSPPILFGTAITATIVTAANGSSAPGSAVDLNIGYK